MSDTAGESDVGQSKAQRSVAVFFRALLDVWNGLERSLVPGPVALAWVFVGLMVGWWIYVPFHELLHAAGCWLTGGSVTRLEIARVYGGDLYALIFPFVEPGGEYAGRLSGFDTFGNDLIYLATDFSPFLLTIFPGIYLLRRSVASGSAFYYGFWLSFALAPFMSLTGDAYEIGSIVVTQLSPWQDHSQLLRSDDLLLWMDTYLGQSGIPWGGAVLGATIGLLWAVATYSLGSFLSSALGYGPIPPLEPEEAEPQSEKTDQP